MTESMRSFDPGDLEPGDIYQLMISAIVPRPIALVATMSEAGVANISPFSFFTGISARPPLVAISVARGRHGEKDTMRNIRTSREFVVNVVDRKLAAAAVATSGAHEPSVSEFKVAGLTPLPSDKIRVPRVSESPVHFECIATELIESPGGSEVTLVLGRVLRFHVARRVWTDKGVDPHALDPVARLGQDLYAGLGETFRLPPPPAPGP